MCVATLCIIAPNWKQSRCPSRGEWLKNLWYIQAWNTTQPGKEMSYDACNNQDESTGTCTPCWVTSVRSHVL